MREIGLITKLKRQIEDGLQGLIGTKCALFDLPYHTNIGDGLIWNGEKHYLSSIGVKSIYNCSYFTCTYPNLSEDVTILFHGGGNFGDLYHEHIDFLQSIINKYPNHRIIVFPQTVYYQDVRRKEDDLKKIRKHPNIIICARDMRSYETLFPYLKDRVRLIPDMAFCIPTKETNYTGKIRNTKLFIVRKDGELANNTLLNQLDGNVVKMDWPTFYHKPFDGTFVFKTIAKLAKYDVPLQKWCLDHYCNRYFSENLLEIGVNFIGGYNQIITTRLHGCILAILLGKEVVLMDNSYGKNSSFYSTWLTDFNHVSFL